MKRRFKSNRSFFKTATRFFQISFAFFAEVAFLPVLSGVLVALGFPGEGFPWISAFWLQPIALVPLFVAFERTLKLNQTSLNFSNTNNFQKRLKSLCTLTLIFGATVNLIAFWWTTKPAILFGGIPAAATYPTFFLYAFLSATFYLLVFAPFLLELATRKKDKPQIISVFPLAFIFVAIEIISPRFFYWSFGSLTHGSDALNQWSSVFGFASLSFVVVCSGALLGRALAGSHRRTDAFSKAFVSSIALWGFAWGGGAIMLNRSSKSLTEAPLTHVAWVQPNFTFNELSSNPLRSSADQVQSMENLLAISREALDGDRVQDSPKRQLLIWPESVTPSDFAWNKGLREQASAFAAEQNIVILAQGVEFDRAEVDAKGWRNAAMKSISFLIRPDGSQSQNHEKWIPIPFGESVPFEDFAPSFGNWIRSHIGNTSKVARGTTYEALAYTPEYRVAPMICFDAIEPGLARKQARLGGASIYVNQSNFVWMGKSNAGHEFMELTRYRAIENGRSMVLAANTGPSGAFDPIGRIVSGPSTLMTRQFGRASLPVVQWTTPYQVWGNFPIYLMALLSLVYVTLRGRRHSR